MYIKEINNIIEVTYPISLDDIVVKSISESISKNVLFGEYNSSDGSRASHIISHIDKDKVIFRTVATYWGKVLKDRINDGFSLNYENGTINIIQL